MDTLSIINITTLTLLFLLAAKYDVHMFQLSSYRYNRYWRWLFPANIHTHGKWLLLLAALFANIRIVITSDQTVVYVPLVLLPATAYVIYEIRARRGYKTPLVFTDRVKRLCTTTLLLYLVVATSVCIYSPHSATIALGVILLLSNAVVLLGNLLNTPLERLINRHYYNDAKKIINSHKGLIVIGITGSFGKTSTKNYLAGLLAEKYNVLVTPGNFNTLLGVIRTIREQLRPYHQVFIVEMGAKQRGDIKEICDLVHPQIGIVTAVGEMHLETFKNLKNIQRTKFELINSLPTNGLGVINHESQAARDFKEITSDCHLLTYAIEQDAMLRANDVAYNANGISFTVSGERFESHLLGSGNLLNMLAAIITAQHLGVPAQKQKTAISRLQPVEHRLSMRHTNGITVLDDAYNSNPQGAKMALEVLHNFTLNEGNKRIIITPGFVEMGARQFEANRELGNDIAKCADYAIIVNITNREAIVKGIGEHGMPTDKYFMADTLHQAHAHLATILKTGDVVLYENDLPDNFK